MGEAEAWGLRRTDVDLRLGPWADRILSTPKILMPPCTTSQQLL